MDENNNIPTHTQAALAREEWQRRYAARIMEVAGLDERAAMQIAQDAADGQEYFATAEGRTVAWVDPEDAADSEMSYWGDDGDQ